MTADDPSEKSREKAASDLSASMIDDLCRRCLARPAAEWSQAIAGVCVLYPEHESAIRERFEALRRATKTAKESFFVEDLDEIPDHAPADEKPRETGEFAFERELGRGGMGVVYEAKDKNSGRKVAVKVVSPHLELSASAVERFEREAKIAAQMSHPNCVFVYGAHRVEGRLALSMELMTGRTLEDVVKEKRRLPYATIVAWTIDILNGLEAAHAMGIVHRDIKPSNIFLDTEGRVKIGDFGLSLPSSSDLKLTRSGMFLGSPMYASPEQIRAKDVDQRSDIYSAGATLYALLTGEVPHDASNIGDLFARIATEEVRPPWEIRDDCPKDLAKVALRALDKDPAKRWAGAAEMRAALMPFVAQPLVPAALTARALAYITDLVFFSIVGGLIYGTIEGFAVFTYRPLLKALPFVKHYGGFLLRVLYFGAFEGILGASPGKAIFGLRVTRADASRVSWKTAALRAVLFNPEVLVPLPWFAKGILNKWKAVTNVMGLLLPMSTMRKKNGFEGVHDRFTRTRVVRKRTQPLVRFLHRGRPLEAVRSPGAPAETLAAYRLESEIAATAHGTLFLARDTKLDREVWLHVARSLDDRLDKASRSRADTTMLRWLDGGDGPRPYDVFESPGGASLLEYEERGEGLVWGLARGILVELARRLAAGAGISPRRVWIDRAGALRLLDFELAGGAEVPGDVLARTADALLPTASRTGVSSLSMPAAALDVVKRLRGQGKPFASHAAALDALLALDVAPRPLTRFETFGIYFARLATYSVLFTGLGLTLLYLATGFRQAVDEQILAPLSNPQLYVLICLALGVFPAVVSAAFLRGGMLFRWIGVKIVDREGTPVGALRCTIRSLVSWAPMLAVFAVHAFSVDAFAAAAVIASLAYFFAFVAALIRPVRGIADLLVGTYAVR